MKRYFGLVVVGVMVFASCSGKSPPKASHHSDKTAPSSAGLLKSQEGIASYYAHKFNGRRTASGERFSNKKMTAAHRTLPFGTLVEVENMVTHQKVIVKINDRGPFVRNRIIDLSYSAAKKLGFIRQGSARVKISPLTIATEGKLE